MRKTYRFNGSDVDGISSLHPYYSRDYRSTSHMIASLAKDRCFSRGPGVWFRCFRFVKNHDFAPRLGPKNRPCAKPFERTVLSSYFMKNYDILTK